MSPSIATRSRHGPASRLFKGMRLRIAALLWVLLAHGIPAPAASPVDGFDNTVLALALQADGKVLVGGYFTSVGGLQRAGLARLNSDGSVDGSFAPPIVAPGYVTSIALRADAKIVVGGYFPGSGNAVMRLNADGSLDAYPSAQPDSAVSRLVNQTNDGVVIGGDFVNVDSHPYYHVARLKPDGSVDGTFSPVFAMADSNDANIYDIELQPDGKILVAGHYQYAAGTLSNGLVRLQTDGTPDPDFNWPFATGVYYPEVDRVLPTPTAGLLVAGPLYLTGYPSTVSLALLKSDGSLDTSLTPGYFGSTQALARQSSGDFLIGGILVVDGNPNDVIYLARISPTGSVDFTFPTAVGTGPNNAVTAIAVQADDRLLVGGGFTQVGNKVRNHIARLNANGSLDLTFTTTDRIFSNGF